MPSLKQIKRRIGSIQSTRQITRAMKMVAAAKLRRAQEEMMKARPYSDRLKVVIRDLAARTNPEAHPLLSVREPKNVALVIVTSDRGLAGGFNNNICRRAEEVIADARGQAEEVRLVVVGKKGYDYFRTRGGEFIQHHLGIMREFDFGAAASIGDSIRKLYEIGYVEESGLDRIYLIYNEFKSVIQQEVIVEQLYPIIPDLAGDEQYPTDFIYEPSEKAVLDHVLPLYTNVTIWRVLLESFAAELAARMNAMESATKNAGELIDKLTIQYNKARQASITREILEVISGSEGMK